MIVTVPTMPLTRTLITSVVPSHKVASGLLPTRFYIFIFYSFHPGEVLKKCPQAEHTLKENANAACVFGDPRKD